MQLAMDELAIKVDNISKSYFLRPAGGQTLKSAFLDLVRGRRATQEFHALKGINFSVAKGETLGIIGANGAGKSTLLAILTGTTKPTSGSVRINGSISALLELGAGFHPDLTGRENIFLSGAIMGISRKQMLQKVDSIIEFAEIREYIDQPVKHYSSGMYVRLGFAVAVEVDPEILLIDEVLAVGDMNFQRKCIQKMNQFKDRGKTMLVISHDMKTIQTISDRMLLLEQGKLIDIGEPTKVVQSYESLDRMKNLKALERDWGTGEVKITGVDLLDKTGTQTKEFRWSEPFRARIHFVAHKRIENAVFGFALADDKGQVVYGNNTQIVGHQVTPIDGKGSIDLIIDKMHLAAGTYLLSVSVHSHDHLVNYHRVDNAYQIEVRNDTWFAGICYMPCAWNGPSRESGKGA
ncbi:MAG: ABC transporter ATP-binding protein [Verrucomicrobia bacterium]|nr:ABC transporter ATP-binding protein [Verrucomicrobiota bacterium]